MRCAPRLSLWLLLAFGLMPATACSDDAGGDGETDTGGTGDEEPHVTLEATGSVGTACSPGSVGSVQLRATKVGCEKAPPAPCTLPNPPPVYESAALACPIDADLSLDLEDVGRYAVELVRDPGGSETLECWGEEVLVSTEGLEARETVTVSMSGAAGCDL